MSDIYISVQPHAESGPDIVPPPPGYTLRRVRPWHDPIMASYGYSVMRGGKMIGQFQVVTCYLTGYDPTKGETPLTERWVGQWSAIANYNRMGQADLLRLARMQLLEFGYPFSMSDRELLAMKFKKLPDGYSLQEKIGWLYQGNVKGATVMWGSGDWDKALYADYGTMVNGGQLVAVSNNVRTFRVRMPERSYDETVEMRELLTFRRADLGKTHKQYPYLAQYATVANVPNSSYGENIRGHVICPVALNADDFRFGSTFRPTRYYLPEIWLTEAG